MTVSSFCSELSTLVTEHAVAAARYHREITLLAKVAGKQDPEAFRAAMEACSIAREDCARTTSAVTRHRGVHGC